MANRREVDDATLARASLVAVDSIQQAREESGDLIQGFRSLGRGWDDVVELHEIVAGARPTRRNPQEITLFKSNGIALWDVAVAGYMYRQALKTGKGQELNFGSR
jgi:ornithine cyclodeaminase/alanine dehydrogenase-like protein (mu-crystallin family)